MPGKIFISYRRDDVAGDARSMRDGLAARFGRHSVFMDVDDLLLGQRFDRELAKALDGCDVLIAVIGPRWMELLKAKAARSERDYVRLEIAEALRRGIVVVPVLVGRIGQMPALPGAGDLPEDIRDLTWHQKHDVTHERFGRDLTDLGDGIVGVLNPGRPPGPAVPWRWVGAVASAVALAVAVWVFWPSERTLPVSPAPKAAEAHPKSVPPPPPALKRISPTRAPAPLTAEEEHMAQAKDAFKECDVCPEMVVVPAGSFTMGSPPGEEGRDANEGPQRRLTITRPFAVGKFEVTFAEWDACLAEGGCKHRPDDNGWGRGKRPVMRVSWDDITHQYLPWLSRKTGKAYRLLTEAEWEYVARAGTRTLFWWGSSISPSQANYFHVEVTHNGRRTGTYPAKTLPVDSFAPNPWGLYNVHGNVLEWVQDCFHNSYNGAPTDGSAKTTIVCSSRVLRGGCWRDNPERLRAAYRFKDSADVRFFNLGFRLGRTL